jgi:glycosyltransferase involved in cell wall biosynthesis
MTPLSIVIVAFNEQAHIGRCIDSVLGIADDIVVIDSFSTDRTREICLEKKVRVIQHPFEGHVSQKNLAITHAKFPHVLSLDADEWLSDTLKQSIGQVKTTWNSDGYEMNRLNCYCGQWIRHGSWYPDRKLRLWDSRKGSWGGQDPHDRFILRPRATRAKLEGDLLHQAYDSISGHLKKVDSYSRIAADAMFNKGVKATWMNLLFHPAAAFFKSYLIRLGFLDGWNGFVIARIISYGTFLKYCRLREYHHAIPVRENVASPRP